MLYQISINDLDEIGLSLDLFEGYCLKYCIARDQNFEVFHEKVKHIKHSLTHFITPWRRTKRLYEQFQELHQLFVENEKGMPLQNRLKMLSEDLTYDISLLFEAESDFDPSSIFDIFDSIIELSDEIKQHGYDTYQLFRQLIRNIGACKPHIPSKTSKTNMPRPADIKMLRQTTGQIFSYLDDIIAIFDQPPAPKKADEKKKDKKNYELDIDEVKRSALTSQALHYIFKENWTPLSTARHLNMTIEDLFELLDIEFESEDEKKEAQDVDDKNDKTKQEDAEGKEGDS